MKSLSGVPDKIAGLSLKFCVRTSLKPSRGIPGKITRLVGLTILLQVIRTSSVL